MALARVPDVSEDPCTSSNLKILLIPGLGPGCPPVHEWGICTEAWQTVLSGFKAQSTLLQISHGVQSSAGFKYQELFEAGDRLRGRIFAMCDGETQEAPMIFIAHSIGGSILKHVSRQRSPPTPKHKQELINTRTPQALFHLAVRAREHEAYARILHRIAGVIFISSPHGTKDPSKLQKHVDFLLEKSASGTLNSQTLTRIDRDFEILINIHERFTDTGFRFEVLSSYETDTCTVNRTFRLSKKIKIMDEALVKMYDETVVSLEGDHFSCCKLVDRQGRPHTTVVNKLREMIERAEEVVRDRNQTFDVRMSSTSTPSLNTQASVEAMRKDKSKAFSETSIGLSPTSLSVQKGSSTFSSDMDTIFEKFTPKKLDINLPCFMMEPGFTKNTAFYGRDDILTEMDQILLPDRRTISPSTDPASLSVAILHGMPGVGKTEIATQFVFTRQDHFDAIFWICAETETKLETDFCRIAVELGVQDDGDQSSPVITKNKVKSWLTKPTKTLHGSDDLGGVDEANWLIVFDNADQPKILRDYTQIFGRGSILVTSRDPTAKRFCESSRLISKDLQPFNKDEACSFLSALTQAPSDTKSAFRIANHHLGGLPLAIAQVASFINSNLMSYEDVAESLENPEERLDVYQSQENEDDFVRTSRGDTASIWAIQKLGTEEKLMAGILSLLFPDSILKSILHGRIEDSPIVPISRLKINQIAGSLARQGLIRYNEERQEIWMHRIPRHVIRAHTSDAERLESFLCAIKLIIAAWPQSEVQNRHNKATVPERERLLPHVLSLTSFYEHDWQQNDKEVDFKLARLLFEASWFMYERGNLARGRPFAELGLRIYEKNVANTVVPGQAELWMPVVVKLHDVLGCIANGTNTLEASMRHNSKHLELRQQLCKGKEGKHFSLAYAHNQKGCAWMMARKYEEGKQEYQEALRLHSLSGEKGLASMEHANLGLCLWLLERIDEASEVLEKGLKEREDRFGQDNPESFKPGRILHALGNVRASQSRFAESEAYHQRALRLYVDAVGPGYHRVGDMCHKLAQHALRHNTVTSLSKALTLVNQALAIWHADSSTYRPEIARTAFLKSKILFRMKAVDPTGDSSHEEGLRLFAEAADAYRSLVPGGFKKPEELTEEDFDREIMFWSR